MHIDSPSHAIWNTILPSLYQSLNADRDIVYIPLPYGYAINQDRVSQTGYKLLTSFSASSFRSDSSEAL